MTEPSNHVRITLIHGVLQRIADDAGVRMLHIKGPAVAPELLDVKTKVEDGEEVEVTVPRGSGDADVLVHPADVRRFLKAVHRYGWVKKTSFYTGSAFGHAQNIYHPKIGNADVHRYYPGLPESAFQQLWANRGSVTLGNVNCPVPSLRAQRLILLLHGARSGPTHPDVGRAWGRASEEERADVRYLAGLLNAELGLAAALDELDGWEKHPEYLLWKHFREANPSRLNEWRARWRAARTLRAKSRVVRSFIFFDPSSLESTLGHKPTAGEIAKRNVARIGTLVRELRRRRDEQ
ncbi:MAG: 2-nitropropane dioxygenase [Propionibacteriaceae bacterium]|nr:2-nitropropane dioxygenase [Propionibacteriaceae bacterium]